MKAFICIAGIILLIGCVRQDPVMVDSLVAMEDDRYGGVTDVRINELKEKIRFYKAEVDRTVKATEQLGVYYKMLAVEYRDREMYKAAYDAYRKALDIHPENEMLML